MYFKVSPKSACPNKLQRRQVSSPGCGNTRYNGLYGGATPKWVPISDFTYMHEMVGISLNEVYEG